MDIVSRLANLLILLRANHPNNATYVNDERAKALWQMVDVAIDDYGHYTQEREHKTQLEHSYYSDCHILTGVARRLEYQNIELRRELKLLKEKHGHDTSGL